MKDWKIGTRIGIGFAVIIAITVSLGLFAYSRTTNIGASTSDLGDNYLPSVTALSHIVVTQSHVHAALLKHISSTDPAEMAGIESQIVALKEVNAKAFEKYETYPQSTEEKELYARVKANKQAIWGCFERILVVSRLGTEESNLRALKMHNDEYLPLYEKYVDSVQELFDFNMKGANKGLVVILDAVNTSRQVTLAGLLLAVAIAIPIAFYIVRSITKPLQEAVSVLGMVGDSNLSVTLDLDSQDEIGQMANALNSALAKLRKVLHEVMASATSASVSSEELSSAAGAIASGSQEQAASLEETSASIEEIAATVRQSADNARQANQLASSSKDTAERGQVVVNNAVSAMAEINTASANIADIISTIDEIAFQTNLLAVNAAVEAARAGEQGRGFAVVATEVRSLAQRSAAAAKEIKALIQDSLKKVGRGTDLVNKCGETLETIVQSVNKVTDIVQEISAASQEQSTGIDQISTAVSQIDQVTQSNSAQTEELSSTAQTLSAASIQLTKLVGTFKLDPDEAASFAPHVPAHKAAPLRSTPFKSVAIKASRLKPAFAATAVSALKLGFDSHEGQLRETAAAEPAATGSFEEF